MFQKDIAEKLLVDYEDVFADIVNVLLFKGERVIEPIELSETGLMSHYKADTSKLHEQERDMAKYWNKGNVRIAICGMENQTKVDNNMPVRVIGYDGAAYRSQILKEQGDLYPVVTIVLYYGNDRWDKKHSLFDCVKVPENLKPYVNDYKINVFELAYLEDETVDMFTSDFKHVVQYLTQMRKYNEYVPSPDKIIHVDELMKLFSVFTEDNRYLDLLKLEGGVDNMCPVLERAEQKGKNAGKIEGKVIAYSECGLSVDEIAVRVDKTEQEVVEILKNTE
ncbi:MAG: Rpn family recombination-promoting nuclease/putative transposase [Lachnospiraceae bacterium]|nr:Rpn family recombination-promoting nuclease/putative transposase [Lachnospiraceae bacterium]